MRILISLNIHLRVRVYIQCKNIFSQIRRKCHESRHDKCTTHKIRYYPILNVDYSDTTIGCDHNFGPTSLPSISLVAPTEWYLFRESINFRYGRAVDGA